MYKILILGGTGFIGKNLVIKFLKKNWIVTSISNSKKIDIKSKLLKQYCVNLSNINLLTKTLKNKSFDFVINVSGYVDHDTSYKKINKIITEHFINVLNIVNVLNKKKLRKFIQIGTGDEYGLGNINLNENVREMPITTYALSKLASTQFLQMLHKTNDFPVIILRVFLLYGPHQETNRLIPYTIKNCLLGKKFSTSSGNQLRDFCYIDDFVELIFKVLLNRKNNGEIINVGSGKKYKVKNVINLINQKIKSGKPIFGKIKQSKLSNQNLIPNLKRLNKMYKWKAKTSIEKGVQNTIDFIKQNGF